MEGIDGLVAFLGVTGLTGRYQILDSFRGVTILTLHVVDGQVVLR